MKKLIVALLALVGFATGHAQKPAIHEYVYSEKVVVSQMSDNGSWLVANNGESVTRLVNLSTDEATLIGTEEAPFQGKDVANDGQLVVGSKDGVPGYWTSSKAWTALATAAQYPNGNAFSVTPDGRLACGVLYQGEGYNSIPALWDLSTGRLLATAGLPTKDMTHKDQGMMDFRQISADGRYLLGCMSYSYLPAGDDAGGCFYFVYDRTAATYKVVGFTESDTQRWTPQSAGLIVVMEATMSNNGAYVTGQAHVAREVEGSEFGEEYEAPFRFDVAANVFTLYDDTSVQGSYGTAVTNDGQVLASAPAGNPIRAWSVMSGKYWYSFDEILSQKYQMNFADFCQSENTGTPVSVSDDGVRVAVFPDPYSSYVAVLPVPVGQLGEGMKLLGSYTVQPAAGAVVSHLKNATVSFTRPITAVGGANSAQLLDDDDVPVHTSVGFTAEGKNLSIRFRTGTLEAGRLYNLYIPEGTVALSDDATQTNADIYIPFTGRADEPVPLVKAYPADEATFSKLDFQTNPIVLDFAENVVCPKEATAVVYRNDEATPYATLLMAYGKKQVMVYPATTLYLFDGNDYRVEIAAGSVTDVAGNNPSEPITLHYHGNYVRQIAADDVVLFEDGFQNGLGNFMQWCGDQLTPTAEMLDLDFKKGLGWSVVLESHESGDYAAASHSQYNPAGTSDDWLVTPQIYVPDMLCALKFLSQSYRAAKKDRLKVVVWESNNVYNELSADIVAKMKAEGTVVYDKEQTPGASEDNLAGDWLHNDISLAQFAGKNIYIAFVNQDTDQSCVFIDSVAVRHEMSFLTALDYETNVVAQTEAPIRVVLTGNNTSKAYQTATLELSDANGQVVDTATASDLNLAKGVQHTFTFAKGLPLVAGQENKFSILVTLDDERNEVVGSVKNLLFQPEKRVVVEEYSGRTCGNCPLGIVGMEKLVQRYGDKVVPVCIRTYGNDPASAGLSFYSTALGLNAAPSAVVNRGTPSYPAVSATVDKREHYYYTVADLIAAIGEGVPGADYSPLWADLVAEEMNQPTEAEITATLDYDAEADSFVVKANVRYALNATHLSVNLFTTLVEDQVTVNQQNYFSQVPTNDIGEWGLGHTYGKAIVTGILMDDVCRGVLAQSVYGTGGYVPSTVVAGESYAAEYGFHKPSIAQNAAKCKAVVMMIDANTGRVINAVAARSNAEDAIQAIDAKGQGRHTVYDLQGRRVEKPTKGLYIVDGHKVMY